MKLAVIVLASVLLPAPAARADATCESARADLTGANVYGHHTIGQLVEKTEAGDCRSAAALSRRARDVEGFVATHCPSEASLHDMAAHIVSLAQTTLSTPECQN